MDEVYTFRPASNRMLSLILTDSFQEPKSRYCGKYTRGPYDETRNRNYWWFERPHSSPRDERKHKHNCETTTIPDLVEPFIDPASR